MPCKVCGSVNQREFPSEISIHARGWKRLDRPSVWAFPSFLVCTECGFTELILENGELRNLRENHSNDPPAEGANWARELRLY